MIIQFGELNLKLLIPLLFPIFLKFRRLNRRNNDINSTAFSEFCNFLSITPCIILYYIQKCRSKSEKTNSSINENVNSNSYRTSLNITISDEMKKKNNKTIKEKIKQFFFIALISFLQLCASMLKAFYYKKINKSLKSNVQPIFQLLFLILFCIIFLKFSIFSHQIVSVIVICICLIIFFIESIFYQNIQIGDIIGSIFFYFFLQMFYILSNVLGKKYLNKYVENFYLFLFKYCIIALIVATIYGIIIYYINLEEENFKIFNFFSKIQLWIFLVDLFFSFLFEIGLWLTIYYFNPCYYFIFETISDLLEIILSKFDKTAINYSFEQLITFYILYPIILFAIFVFNEIIILNFCNLNYNVKINIAERSKNEFDTKQNEIQYLEFLDDNNSEDGYIVLMKKK